MEKYFPNQTPMELTTTTPTIALNTIPTAQNSIPSTNVLNTKPTTPNTTPTDPTVLDTTTVTTDPMIIQDDNATSQLKSPKKEVNEKPPKSKKKPTRTSDIWEYFTKVKDGDPENPRCTCNYCGADYACHSQRVGTSSLWVHLDKCKKNPQRIVDKKQKVLSKTKIGPPTSADWECASVFVKFLATFYEVTLKFSGTLHVTSNNFYHEICEIQAQVKDLADENDPLLSTMAVSMRDKYDKYWGNADNINPLLFVAVVLDPRYKMKYLKFCFEYVYDSATVSRLLVKVESTLQSLYTCYVAGSNGIVGNKDVRDDPPPKSVVGRSRLLDNYMQSQQTETNGNKTDLDNYLAEEPLNPMTTSFDILLWWKDNSIRYKTLSLIAKDVLAIPVSTVASESAFSTSGRILDPFRSSLSPRMLEVLVCTQSWLKERHDGKKSNEYVDDINSYEFLDEGDKNKTNIGASKEKLKGNVINVIDD